MQLTAELKKKYCAQLAPFVDVASASAGSAGSASDAESLPNRMLGRPKIQSRDALVTVCTAAGLERRAVDKKRQRETFRALKKHPEDVRSLP